MITRNHLSRFAILIFYASPRGKEPRSRLCCTEPVLVAGGRVATHIGKPLHFLGSDSVLPFKHHAEHRHHIPKRRYRVTNWPEYDASLKRRGSLTVWFTGEAAAWRAEPRSTPGGQPHCHVRFQGVRTQKSTRFFSSRLVSPPLCSILHHQYICGGDHVVYYHGL
jgi:hypothetical protein